jgi:uncharacterized membrane protein
LPRADFACREKFSRYVSSVTTRNQQPQSKDVFGIAAISVFIAWTLWELWLALNKPTTEAHFGIFLLLGVAATLISENRSLPAQNVFVATAIVLVVTGIVELISAISGIPFGARIFLERAGPQIFRTVPWSLLALWFVSLLNSRAVARMILRPWRKSKTYGFRVMGLTCLLVSLLRLSFEPFAARVNHFWIWQTKETVATWHGAPWVTFFSIGFVALLILVFATPWLMNKHPHSSRRPVPIHSLILWMTMNLYFTAVNGFAGLRLAMFVTLTTTVVTLIFAVRGLRW